MTWNRMDYTVLCGPYHVMGQTKLHFFFVAGPKSWDREETIFMAGLMACDRQDYKIRYGPYDKF